VPLDRRLISVVLATVVFCGSWVLLDHGFYDHGRISDTPRYQGYGLQMRNGELPYRDFSVEYPPGSLPVFLAPTYIAHPTDPADYASWFARLMALCGLACLAAVLIAGAPRRGVAFVAVAPLLVGSIMLTRFDLLPAALTAGALAAYLRDRHGLGWFLLGLAVAVKLFAVVLIPLAAIWTLRRRGQAEFVRGSAVLVATVAAVFVPFAILAPHGLWESLWGQVSRPIQIESLVASVLTTFGHPTAIVSHHSVGIAGHGVLAFVTTVVELAVLLALWGSFARGPVDEERFARFAAAAVCAFVVFGKVLSPQYLIWLVPLLALVRGRRGLVVSALFAAAAIDTQFWFDTTRYAAYIGEFRYAWLVLARDLILVAVLAVLALPPLVRRRRPAPVTA
jgi:hypothetical protein